MEIVDLGAQSEDLLQGAAAMLVEDFDAPAGWPDLSLARQEVTDTLEHGFARALLDSSIVLGWIGGLPEYSGRIWALHPVVVRKGHREQFP